MKNYSKPESCNSESRGPVAVPAILGAVIGVVAAKVVTKALDKAFDVGNDKYMLNALEPIGSLV